MDVGSTPQVASPPPRKCVFNKPQKVLIIGSGPIVIGQAAEFDYAGTQACKALREEGMPPVLVNSNPATIMTDEDVADVVYIEPLTVEVIERIIARERPDGLLPTLGGQTGLNLAVALADAGVLEQHNVRLLGTPLEPFARPRTASCSRAAAGDRRAGHRERDRRDARGGEAGASASACRSSSAPPTRSAAPAAASRTRPSSTSASSQPASPPARSTRCSSSAPCSAGKSSSTR